MVKKKFAVTVYREWTETGRVTIEATDEDEAREIAQEMLSNGDDFEWEGHNMEPGQQDVDSVTGV